MYFGRTDLVKLLCSMRDSYQSWLLFVCWLGFFCCCCVWLVGFVCFIFFFLKMYVECKKSFWTNKEQEYFFHSPFNFQEWFILLFFISNQHFKSKLSYVKLNKHRSKTVCNSLLLFLMCFWFWVDSRLFWFVLHCSLPLCFPLHLLIELQRPVTHTTPRLLSYGNCCFFLKDFHETQFYLFFFVSNADEEVDRNCRVIYSFTSKNLSSWARRQSGFKNK